MIIYKTINLINKKIYIGKDKNNNTNYLGSGNHIISAIKKYGRNNFKKEILEHCISENELNAKEIYWIKKLNSTDSLIGYNILDGGTDGSKKGRKLSDETKEKIRQSLLGRVYSLERREKMSKNNKGISRNKGRKLSDETKEKISNKMSGRKLSNETKKKMSIFRTGKKRKPLSEDHKRKISESMKNSKRYKI